MSHLMLTESEFHQFAAPLTARGYVRFINIRPDKDHGAWICDQCYSRITLAKQEEHARKHS